MQIFIWIIIEAGVLVFAVVMFYLLILLMGVRYAAVLYYSLELMRWYTFDEILAMGYGRSRCGLCLEYLHENNLIETRLHEDLTAEQKIEVNEKGFVSSTIDFYDFRRSVNPSRKKPKFLGRPQFPWEPITA